MCREYQDTDFGALALGRKLTGPSVRCDVIGDPAVAKRPMTARPSSGLSCETKPTGTWQLRCDATPSSRTAASTIRFRSSGVTVGVLDVKSDRGVAPDRAAVGEPALRGQPADEQCGAQVPEAVSSWPDKLSDENCMAVTN